jgi:hypothetical protein
MVTRIEIMEGHSGYASLGGLVVWASNPPTNGFSGLGLKNRFGVLDGLGDGTWHHHEACGEVKQSHEELVALGAQISSWTISPLG